MPIYEYKCKNCNFKFAIMVGVVAGHKEIKCPKCSSLDLTQIISSFKSTKSQSDILNEMDNKFSNVDVNDPRSLTKAMKEMGKAISDDEDLGSNYEEMMDKAEKEVYLGADSKDKIY